ncbi:MAG: hypothetical protein U0936_24050 [Planctomycetaceae bacterium]
MSRERTTRYFFVECGKEPTQSDLGLRLAWAKVSGVADQRAINSGCGNVELAMLNGFSVTDGRPRRFREPSSMVGRNPQNQQANHHWHLHGHIFRILLLPTMRMATQYSRLKLSCQFLKAESPASRLTHQVLINAHDWWVIFFPSVLRSHQLGGVSVNQVVAMLMKVGLIRTSTASSLRSSFKETKEKFERKKRRSRIQQDRVTIPDRRRMR